MAFSSHQYNYSLDCSTIVYKNLKFLYNFKMSFQSSLRQEMSELKISLELLEFERRNLLEHFKIQEDYYAVTFKYYAEKFRLEARLLRENSSAQQDKQ